MSDSGRSPSLLGLCAAPLLYVFTSSGVLKRVLWIITTGHCKIPRNLAHAWVLLCCIFQQVKLNFCMWTQGHFLLTKLRASYSGLQLESSVRVAKASLCAAQVLFPMLAKKPSAREENWSHWPFSDRLSAFMSNFSSPHVWLLSLS